MLTGTIKSNDLINCIHKALEKLDGSFALGENFKGRENVLIRYRRGSH